MDATSLPAFHAALETAGMPSVPEEFSVVPQHQVVPYAIVQEIARFIRVFDRVTARETWQNAARRNAPAIAQIRRPEVCFFSAWDFHLPAEGGCQLIEFNDNGSGCLFAAIINATYHHTLSQLQRESMLAPAAISAFRDRIVTMVEHEAQLFFGGPMPGMVLILDDAESVSGGRFLREFYLLCDIFRAQGHVATIGSPADTLWDGNRLLLRGEPVAFVINRSTDFFWEAPEFTALRAAYESGQVYVAPNPSSYVTRSDKCLLEPLSLPDWDGLLGITAEERAVLVAHVPETHVVRAGNLDMLAQRKHNFIFKPLHGFAGRGVLDSAAVGHARLRRLVRQQTGYVAQRFVPKTVLDTQGQKLWVDLRVWAYRGEIFNLSGRASHRSVRLEWTPPGGWVPTYAGVGREEG